MEGEIWCNLAELQIAAKRDNLSCVVATLDGATYEDVDLFARQRLDLELVAMREDDYYSQLLTFYRPIEIVVWVTALLIALGGFLGGLNTLYSAFAARVREMGALQTLGYSRLALVVSMVQESVLATVGGALLAAALSVLLLDGVAVRFSMGVFGLVIDGPVMVFGMGVGLLLGLLGALPPAWRCLSVPITSALRSA
jgi:putative ABC transport system permease protein